MVDFVATKTRHEVEDEEAERLVRPMPKVKPPRRDLRRERTETNKDPDVEGDPDTKGDPDMSLNYKIIGSVVRRFAQQDRGDRIPAKSRETGEIVQISPDTLKNEPGKYEAVDGEPEKTPEKKPKAEPTAPKKKPETAKEPTERAPPEEGTPGYKLLEHVHGNEELLSHLRSLADPAKLGGFAKENPNQPLSKFGGIGKLFEEATGAKTIGEAFQVLEASGGLKAIERAFKKKVKPAPKPASENPSAEEGAEKSVKKPQEKSKAKGKGKPEAPPKPPTEAVEAGIGEPKRRVASEAEYGEAIDSLMDTFPRSAFRTDLISKNLHPDDVSELIAAYHQAQSIPSKDIKALSEGASKFFQLDPDRVTPPPRARNAAGEEVDFKTLSPEEQADTYRKHQMRVLAASHAIQGKLSKELSMPSWSGKPQIPPEVASSLASFVLSKGKSKTSGAEWSQKMFDAVTESGDSVDIPPKLAQKLLGSLPPDAAEVAQGFLKANDYNTAKEKFLQSGEISEHQRAGAIFKGLKRANEFFAERAKVYGSDKHEAATNFRVRVLGQLRNLDPEKHKKVRALFDQEDADVYDKAKVAHERALKAWESRRSAWGSNKGPYRGMPFNEEPPIEPKKPARYSLTQSPQKVRHEGKALFDDLVGLSKTAGRVSKKFISFYSSTVAMDRKSVYHGIDPKTNDPGPYQGWSQPHARDFGEADSMVILAAAHEWLKQPVLSQKLPGFGRDEQLRAAMDLGLRTSGYSGHVSTLVYDQLLAQLAGKAKSAKVHDFICLPPLEAPLGASRTSHTPTLSARKQSMTTKLSAVQKKAADEVLGLLDKAAEGIQANHAKWGMSFDEAKQVVNHLDGVADKLETSVYGTDSLQRRQLELLKSAKVIKQDGDEPYMGTFNSPTAVHQQDADEPYMSAYADDQTQAVKSVAGR